MVGDEDQSIYRWRGADVGNILNFEKDYPDALVIKLEQNYRSTPVILETANNVIQRNTTSKGKKLWTERKDGDACGNRIDRKRKTIDIQADIREIQLG